VIIKLVRNIPVSAQSAQSELVKTARPNVAGVVIPPSAKIVKKNMFAVIAKMSIVQIVETMMMLFAVNVNNFIVQVVCKMLGW
jgi:hypothetical protein